jgi:hypothetical protein
MVSIFDRQFVGSADIRGQVQPGMGHRLSRAGILKLSPYVKKQAPACFFF